MRSAVPAHERQQVVDAEGDGEHDPFDAAVGAGNALRIDLPARHVERRFGGRAHAPRLSLVRIRHLRLPDKLGQMRGGYSGVHPFTEHRVECRSLTWIKTGGGADYFSPPPRVWT